MFKPNYQLTNAIINHITAITEAREDILRSPILPKAENRLRHDALVSRSHHSTSIEGNRLNLPEVQVIVDGGDLVARPKDKQEIKNYLAALKYLEKAAKSKRLAPSIILKLQGLITKKVLSPKDCGKYRNRMVYVVNSFGQTVFTPPPINAVPQLVADLVKWLNHPTTKELHPVLAAGISHYELVRIHPFIDGNGRMARATATLVLFLENYDIKKFFSLEEYYDHDASRYYEFLKSASSGDLTKWLEYFTEGLAIELTRIKEKVQRLSIDIHLKEKLGGKQVFLSERQITMMEYIQRVGYVQNQTFKDIFPKISEDTILRDLHDLMKKGIIKKEGKTKAARYTLK